MVGGYCFVWIYGLGRLVRGQMEPEFDEELARLRGWVPEPLQATVRYVKSDGEAYDAIEWDEGGRRVQLFEIEVNSEMSSVTRLVLTVSFAGDKGRIDRLLRRTREPSCVHSYAVYGGYVRARMRRKHDARDVIDWLMEHLPEGEGRAA